MTRTGSGTVRDLSVEGLSVYVDVSKHRITRETLQLLVELAEQCGLSERIGEMFAGDEINESFWPACTSSRRTPSTD